MPQGEIFAFPSRKPSADGDVPADVVALLRALAKQAAETGADPSARVIADHELLLTCDHLMALARAADDAWAAYQPLQPPRDRQAYEEWRRRRRAMRPALSGQPSSRP